MTVPRIHARKGFTLIEVLVVVGIVVVIFAIAIPAFVGVGEGQAVTSGVEQLRTTMSLARQHAITKRESVYMVFPDSAVSGAGDYAYRSFRVYGEKSGYITPWRFLPSGVVFSESASPNNVFGFGAGAERSVPFPEPTDPARNVLALEFTPTGSVALGMGANPTVYLTEGWYDEATSVLSERPNAQLRGIQTYRITGLSRINEY